MNSFKDLLPLPSLKILVKRNNRRILATYAVNLHENKGMLVERVESNNVELKFTHQENELEIPLVTSELATSFPGCKHLTCLRGRFREFCWLCCSYIS